MSSQSPLETLKPIIQTYSVLAITLAAGTNLTTTLLTLPLLLHSPSTLAKQWKLLYNNGIYPVVTLTLTSALGFTALAYHASTRERNLYGAAAVAGWGLAPYTRVLMGGLNEELSRRALGGNKEGEGEEEGTVVLVERWGRYNLVRGVMLLVGGGLGMWGCVS